jgi:hypothetical protein
MTLDEIELLTRDSVAARRNFALGLWAGEQLGHRDDDLARYVLEVMDADYLQPGAEDVVRKLASDFSRHGLDACETRLRAQIAVAERRALAELLPTD